MRVSVCVRSCVEHTMVRTRVLEYTAVHVLEYSSAVRVHVYTVYVYVHVFGR